tara:strand:+ start:296 stop:577 length:282 start_codon:yes stop_codon:yes gene_type:complete
VTRAWPHWWPNLGNGDFKELKYLFLNGNKITDAGMATLAAALDAGRLPALRSKKIGPQHFLADNPASASAVQAVEGALAKRMLPLETSVDTSD